jgi:hypothetical protein
VMVTNQLQYLPYADYILVLKNGVSLSVSLSLSLSVSVSLSLSVSVSLTRAQAPWWRAEPIRNS